jgi:hypothetical protein
MPFDSDTDTWTVGLPLESRISRAEIDFIVDIIASLLSRELMLAVLMTLIPKIYKLLWIVQMLDRRQPRAITISPATIIAPPISLAVVIDSCSSRKASKSATITLPLSISATVETSAILIAR